MSTWAGVGPAYDASFAVLCAGMHEHIVEALVDLRGRRVLDVGAGTGSLARALTDAGREVTAVEPDASMRAIAGARYPDLAFGDAALPSLPFPPESFDAVTANFVLNHVADPRASAAAMARVAVPAGRLLATMWISAHGWFWASVCERAGLATIEGERLPPEKDFERTAVGFDAMLREAGWRDVQVRECTWTWKADAASLWASIEGGVATAGMFYRALGVHDRARFRRGFDTVCAATAVDGAIELEHVAALAVGHRPGPA